MCVHIFCRTQKNLHKIPKCVHVTSDQEKIVGFCVKCILQGSTFCEIRQFTTTKISHFDKMTKFSPTTHFFCKTRFVRKYCFQGVRTMCTYIFGSDTKNLQKIPKCVHATVGQEKVVGFCVHCILQGSAACEIR